MPPLRSTELHRAARQELSPTLQQLGFTRSTTSTASWVRPDGERWLVVWVQPYRSTGAPADTRFTIELRLSTKPETGGDGPRKRLLSLLTDEEREAVGRSMVGSADDKWFVAANEAGLLQLMAFVGGILPGAIDRFLEHAR